MAEITVRLLAGEDGEESRKMLRDFSSDIARLGGIRPSTDAATWREPVTLGAIALAAVSSGALTALVQTIGIYLKRDHRNEIEFWIADGEKIRISSTANLIEVEETIRRLLPVAGVRPTWDNRSARKVAILVANDSFPKDHSISPLSFTQDDAKALEEVLPSKACGFTAETHLNKQSYKIRADINRICISLTENDTVIFLLCWAWET